MRNEIGWDLNEGLRIYICLGSNKALTDFKE